MSEYIVDGAEPNSTVLKSITKNGYEHEKWLPVRERIVRCRDCKHLRVEPWDEVLAAQYGAPPVTCERTGDMDDVEPDGFCAWGEKKVDG